MNVHVQSLPENVVTLWLKGVRVPLTIVEAVSGKGDDAANWPPALAFAKVEAAVKDAVGRATGNAQLVGVAQLQRTEVAKREDALAERDRAGAIRRRASQVAETDRQRLAARREAVEETAEKREARLEEERLAADQEVEQRAAERRAASREAGTARARATARRAAEAEQTHLREEADALRAKERAVDAQGELIELDQAIRAKKQARRSR